MVRELTRGATPMVAQLRDLNGNPIAGAAVRWIIKQGPGGISGGGSTDANGLTRAFFTGDLVTTSTSYTQTIIEASTANGRATFYASTTPAAIPSRGIAPDPVVTVLYPNFDEVRSLQGPAGGVLRNALGIRVTNAVGPEQGLGLPNVGIRGSIVEGPITAECSTDALTDPTGFVSCDLRLGPRTGTGTLRFNAGEFRDLPTVQLTITVGGPGKVLIVTGNNQQAPVNQALPTPLTARVTDAGGNPLNNVPVTWTITRGTATLSASRSVTDSNGNTSIRASLGAVPGPITIRASVDNEVFAAFTLTATVVYGGLRVTGGDDQTALTGAPFARPLEVEVRDSGGAIVPGVPVQFEVTQGPAILSAASAVTNDQGLARIQASAGPTSGVSLVSASIDRFSATLTLRTNPRAPLVDAAGIRNAFSNEPGLAPCGLASITGSFLAPGVGGTIESEKGVPLPLVSDPIESVRIAGIPAGIVSVSNLNGAERIIVQTPCEVAGLASANVNIKVTGLESVTVADVAVFSYQPAILEVTAENGRKYAAPGTPVRRGSTVQLLVTGLGQTLPPILTQLPGTGGQIVAGTLTAGISDEGVRITRAEYLQGQAGVYLVEIEVPSTIAAGPYQPVVIAIAPAAGGEPLYSLPAYLIIE